MEIAVRRLAEWKPELELPADGIHIWVADLKGDCAALAQTLSDDEQDRAAKFRMAKTRDQFVASRGLLRQLAAGYLGCRPPAVPIVYESAGKPAIAGNPFHFNVTHSDEIAAFAFSRAGRIGIDIERVRPMQNAASVVERFFTANECAAFQKLPAGEQLNVFFKMWTRKEALLKALGQGIHALELCEITVEPDVPPRVVKLMDEADCGERWQIRDVAVEEGYAAAVAREVR